MTEQTVTILEGGILPIPDSIAKKLGINTGDFLEFTIKDKQVSFKKMEREVTQEEFESNEFLTKVILLNEDSIKK